MIITNALSFLRDSVAAVALLLVLTGSLVVTGCATTNQLAPQKPAAVSQPEEMVEDVVLPQTTKQPTTEQEAGPADTQAVLLPEEAKIEDSVEGIITGLLPAASENVFNLDPGEIIASYEVQKKKSTAARGAEYTLSMGDIIEITVKGEEMSRQIIVPPDGTISFFLVGQLSVLDKKLEEVRMEIEDRLASTMPEPLVDIQVIKFAGNGIRIIGAVNWPGYKKFQPGERLSDLLIKVGGLTMDSKAADLEDSFLIRQGRIMEIDLVGLLANKATDLNLKIEPGDTLVIPHRRGNSIYILGEVGSPTTIPASEKSPTLPEAIKAAEGFMTSAFLGDILVLKGSLGHPKIIRVDYPSMQNGLVATPLLEAGDIVYVPESYVSQLDKLSSQVVLLLSALIENKEVN